MIEHQDDNCLKAIVEQLIAPMFPNIKYWSDNYYWEFSSVPEKDMVLTVFDEIEPQYKVKNSQGNSGPIWLRPGKSAPRLGHFVFSREGLAEALKACGYKNPEEWG